MLWTTGAFVGASVVTLYVVSPYLWANPLRFGDVPATLAHHLTICTSALSGADDPSGCAAAALRTDMFAITPPPVVLVLGLPRVGSVGYGALTRPGGSVRATPLRFGVVLVGRFMVPILAIMLVSSQYITAGGQVYFLYAPFSLLAVYGLHGVTAVSRWGSVRAGVYGLAGLGLGVVVFEMIRLHPY